MMIYIVVAAVSSNTLFSSGHNTFHRFHCHVIYRYIPDLLRFIRNLNSHLDFFLSFNIIYRDTKSYFLYDNFDSYKSLRFQWQLFKNDEAETLNWLS